MNTHPLDKNDPNIGYEYAAANSPLARFIDEQHHLLEKARVEIMHLKEDLRLIEKESEYWKEECQKADATIIEMRKKANG